MIKVIKKMYEDMGLDSDAIKKEVGRSRDWVEQFIQIGTASPEVVAALDSGAISQGVAFQLSRLPFHEQQEEVLNKSTVYRLTVPDVKELVEATLAMMEERKQEQPEAAPAPVPVPVVYYCEACKKETAPRYLRPIQLCPDCFGNVWRLAKEAERKIEEAAPETPGG